MAKNKKPRKVYRPKFEQGAMPVTFRHNTEADTLLKLIPQDELDKLRNGTADEYTVNTLAFRLNIGYVMAGEKFEGGEVRAMLEAALDALRGVKERFKRAGTYGCSQTEFQAIGDGLNLTDEMQEKTTRREQGEVLRIVTEVNNTMKEKSNERTSNRPL